MNRFIRYPGNQKSLLISFCLSLVFNVYFVANGQTVVKTWKGITDQQWSVASNWEPNSIPTSSDDVIILPNATNKLVISTRADCKSLTIENSGFLTLLTGGSLFVSGNWTNNNGVFTPNGHTVTFNGTAQSISGTSTTAFNIVSISSGATVTGATAFTASTFNIDDGGKYIQATGSTVPGTTKNFSTTSTYEWQGSENFPSTHGIAFGNLIINNSGGNYNASGRLTTVNGNLQIKNTGNGSYRIAGDADPTLNVAGDLLIEAGTFILSTGDGLPVLNVNGNILINGGTFQPKFGTGIPAISVKGNWSNSGTFIPGTGTSTVTFNGTTDQTISGTTKFNNLTLSETGKKTIAAGSTVTVSGKLITNDKLVINSDNTNSGSLIVNGTCTDNVTYNRYLDHTNTTTTSPGFARWYIVSAPVTTTSFNSKANADKIHIDASVTPNLYDFATYSGSQNDWLYSYESSSASKLPGTLSPGVGYLISLITTSDGQIQFTGPLNGDLTDATTTKVTVVNNAWNALGNPYTSAIGAAASSSTSVKNFLTENSGILESNYAAIYVWNEPTASAYTGTQQNYKIIGNSGYNGIDALSDKAIQAGQGFLIYVNDNETPQYAKFFKGTAGMQFHKTDLSLKSSEISWPGITLIAESNGQTRSTVVAFNENMTTGLDVSYDAGLLASDDFQVYTHLADGSNTVGFAVQCLPDMQYNSFRIPLGVDLPEGGELVFKVSGLILHDGIHAVLEDQVLGTKTTLKNETDTYRVSLSKNTSGTGRFYLSFAGQAFTNIAFARTSNYTASFVNNTITINGAVEPGAKAILYDLNGRKLSEYQLEHVNRNEISVSGFNQSIIILKIESRNSSQAIKLISVKN